MEIYGEAEWDRKTIPKSRNGKCKKVKVQHGVHMRDCLYSRIAYLLILFKHLFAVIKIQIRLINIAVEH